MFKNRRMVERVKSLLIVLLSCSAVYLAVRIQMPVSLHSLLPTRTTQSSSQTTQESRIQAAQPLRMAVTLRGGEESLRYGVQYDQEAQDILFQQMYSLLVEALSSAEAPAAVDETSWREALNTAPGIYFDWQDELPFSVLVGWLSVENEQLTGSVRRLVLTAQESQAVLYYCGQGETYYRAVCPMVDVSRLSEAVAGVKDNGARFAFEQEEFDGLAPYTLLLGENLTPKIYQASNPLEQEEIQEQVRQTLDFSDDASVSYITSNEQVIRNGNDTLRLAADGSTVTFTAAEEGSRYPVAGSGVYGAVERCRQLAVDTLGELCGQARVYLMSVKETGEESWQIEFGYLLDGVPVRLGEEGYAARFQVSGGRVVSFTLCLRSYTDSGTTSVVLPQRQAMAAMEAKGHQGEELLLVYLDTGIQQVSASWAAAGQWKTGG